MERLRMKYRDAVNAAQTLGDILKEPFSVIVRDATIQRFEYTFEALWKFLKGRIFMDTSALYAIIYKNDRDQRKEPGEYFSNMKIKGCTKI
jgi:hypothetical protein